MITHNKPIEKVMVIGPGMMGTGIAELCAITGYRVVLAGRREKSVEQARITIKDDFDGFAGEGFLTAEAAEQSFSRMLMTIDMSQGFDSDLVIETISEDLEAKRAIFKYLDENCGKETVLATDTSTLSVASIGSVTNRRDKVVGMHFFTCVPKNRLLEVIRSKETSSQTIDFVREFARQTGKSMVIAQDTPGFIINRLQAKVWNEAATLVMEGSDPKDVDDALLATLRPNWGTLALCDFCGMDLMLKITEILWNNLKTQRYRPCPLLAKLVEADRLGIKTGKGFYTYNSAESGGEEE